MFKCVSLAMLLAAGCAFDSSNQLNDDGGVPQIDGPTIDASSEIVDAAIVDASPADAAPDAEIPDAEVPDATPCVGDLMGFDLLNMDRCDPSAPITDLILDQDGFYLFNGITATLQDPDDNNIPLIIDTVAQGGGAADLLIITVTNFEIASNSRLRLIGPNPVVIISTGDMDISGRLQATRVGVQPGAGGNIDINCSTGAGTNGALQPDENGRIGGSGGGGAGFGTAGGFGARVVTSADDNSPGGTAALVQTLEPLRGGCQGGNGGGDGGEGGFGGGAIHLAAAGTISIDGLVSASGSGGRGVSGVDSGGGGGGSGGAVLIQAGTLVNNGIITINGGGGGEGSSGVTSTTAGANGSLNTNNAATGGSGASNGGNGGDGATINDAAGDGTEGNQSDFFVRGGGGGGGGIGVVRIETVN